MGKKKTNNLSEFLKKASKSKKVILIIILVLVVGFFLVGKYRDYQEKQVYLDKFETISEYADRISGVAKPDRVEEDKSCRYQSRKWGRGDLYCGVKKYLYYENQTVEQANQKKDDFIAEIGTGVSRWSPTGVVPVPMDFTENGEADFSQAIIGLDSSCSVGYTYPLSASTEDKTTLAVFISCNSPARAEHFPVRK